MANAIVALNQNRAEVRFSGPDTVSSLVASAVSARVAAEAAETGAEAARSAAEAAAAAAAASEANRADLTLSNLSDAAAARTNLDAVGSAGGKFVVNDTGSTAQTITTPVGTAQAAYAGELLNVTNASTNGQYGVRVAFYNKTGALQNGGGDIPDTLIARYNDIRGGLAWMRWDVIQSPLNHTSGLPTAPTVSQQFYMVAAEINPQNRHSQGTWEADTRFFLNPVGGHQMVAETQDFTSLLPAGTRRGYDCAFAYAISRSPFTNSDEQRHARFQTGILVNPNSISANGAFLFATGQRDFPTAIAIANGGTGYAVGNILTFNTGLSQSANHNTTVRVKAVNGSGVITSAEIWEAGWYQQSFAATVGVTGGSGSGATFTYTLQTTANAPHCWGGIAGRWAYGIDGARPPGVNGNVGKAVFGQAMIRAPAANKIVVARNNADSADIEILGSIDDTPTLAGRKVRGWTDYTPTITAGTGSFTTVSVISARYMTINNTCFFNVTFQLANAGTGGQDIRVTLPINAAQSSAATGRNTTTFQQMHGAIDATNHPTFARFARYDAASPINNGNFYVVSGSYEIAS